MGSEGGAPGSVRLASGAGRWVLAVSIDEAVDRAAVLVPAVWLDTFEQLIAQYGGRLAGKVIADPTNPVGPDGDGGYRKVIGEQESFGQIRAAGDLTYSSPTPARTASGLHHPGPGAS